MATAVAANLHSTPMPTAHIFIAASLDGFIARQDGSIDWLLARDDPAEDNRYSLEHS
jgi:dihydrofolate reductase